MNGKRQALQSVNNGMDRISSLPIPLLHYILSFLSMQDVSRTCVLSKNWRTIWCFVPTLFLDDTPFADWDDYFKFVDTLLLLRDGCNIYRLSFSLDEMTCNLNQVNVWIQYAIRHNVRVLDLAIDILNSDDSDENDDDNPANAFKLPLYIFTSKSLTELYLSYNKCLCLPLPSSICSPSLRSLQLRQVTIQYGHLLGILLSTSPFLVNLILRRCDFKCLYLSLYSCTVRNLVMIGHFPAIGITTPNLVSLNLEISQACPSTINIECSLLFLTSAIISIRQVSSQTAAHLISMVKNARSFFLGLSYWRAHFVADLENNISILKWIQTPFCNLKCLMVETILCHSELVLIHYVLKYSPQIESLILVINRNWEAADEVDHCVDDKMWSNCELSHLKVVEIQYFKGSENELKMVKFILENALVLDKLIITSAPHHSVASKSNQEMANIGRKLLTYPRASSSVGILFSQNLKTV